MPTLRPKLSRVAEAGIRELRSDFGIEPTLDEIIWLHELGKIQEAAGKIDGILEGPAQAGSAFLWPMTIMAAEWYRNYACTWFVSSKLYTFYALTFALAHGRGQPIPDTARRGWFERLLRRLLNVQEERTLKDLLDRREAIEAIKKWILATGATEAELSAAFDVVMPAQHLKKKGDEDDEPVHRGTNYDDIVHSLAALSGTDPDYWRTRTSKDETMRAYLNACMIERARQHREGPSPLDALGIAIQNFRNAIVAIIEAHRTEQPQEDAV